MWFTGFFYKKRGLWLKLGVVYGFFTKKDWFRVDIGLGTRLCARLTRHDAGPLNRLEPFENLIKGLRPIIKFGSCSTHIEGMPSAIIRFKSILLESRPLSLPSNLTQGTWAHY